MQQYIALFMFLALAGCKKAPEAISTVDWRKQWSAVAFIQGTPPAGQQVGLILNRARIPFAMEGSGGWAVYVPSNYAYHARAELKKSFPTNHYQIEFLPP
jgi:hypothetical protein